MPGQILPTQLRPFAEETGDFGCVLKQGFDLEREQQELPGLGTL